MAVALRINILPEALVLKLFYKTINNRKILGVSTLMPGILRNTIINYIESIEILISIT